MTDVIQKNAEEALRKSAQHITENDLRKVLQKQSEIENKFRGNGPLGQFLADLRLLFSIIRDYSNGSYRTIPFWSIAAIAGALLYVLSPVDLIPDFIPGIGYVDDAFVVAACLRMVKQDLTAYRQWKTQSA